MDARYKRYSDFKDAFIAAHNNLKADLAHKRAQKEWNTCKQYEEEVTNLIRIWNAKAAEMKGRLVSNVGSRCHA